MAEISPGMKGLINELMLLSSNCGKFAGEPVYYGYNIARSSAFAVLEAAISSEEQEKARLAGMLELALGRLAMRGCVGDCSHPDGKPTKADCVRCWRTVIEEENSP